MANRIVLNETSYHGSGAIKEIVNEVKGRNLKKAFVCSDPDLIKFKSKTEILRFVVDSARSFSGEPSVDPVSARTIAAPCCARVTRWRAGRSPRPGLP